MDNIYDTNMRYIRELIKKKQSSTPYFATESTISGFVTDFDHFPYTRHFRGEYNNSMPVILGRDVGWRPRRDECYRYVSDKNIQVAKPNHCFAGACNSVKPCRPEELNPIADKDASDLTIQNRNIIDYR